MKDSPPTADLSHQANNMQDRITVNGIAYVREDQSPDCARFYFMHDGFYFTKLNGASLEEIAAHASALAQTPEGSWGCLCPVILMRGDKEIRRAGPIVHAKGLDEPRKRWNEEIQRWIEILSEDSDVTRLLSRPKSPDEKN